MIEESTTLFSGVIIEEDAIDDAHLHWILRVNGTSVELCITVFKLSVGDYVWSQLIVAKTFCKRCGGQSVLIDVNSTTISTLKVLETGATLNDNLGGLLDVESTTISSVRQE